MIINRLNYIGSKFQLLSWLESSIKEKTGYSDFKDKVVADLFAGTGIVSHHFRTLGAITITNDAELYSSIISEAFALSTYTEPCSQYIMLINNEIIEKKHITGEVGYIQKHYSPFESCQRMFFTIENAMRIDYIRQRIEDIKVSISHSDYTFLLASLLLSADAVSNVPAVYGCYLKKFKAKAEKLLILKPIHNNTLPPVNGSKAYCNNTTLSNFLVQFESDIVYLDPPYNQRQYSKNYFPLNMIAKTPEEKNKEPELKGMTGIPQTCFISTLCQKNVVESEFTSMIRALKTKWIFISYNSESLIKKDAMIKILEKFGEVSVIEREYKRFKSFEYNEDKAIMEYLFCLKKTPQIV